MRKNIYTRREKRREERQIDRRYSFIIMSTITSNSVEVETMTGKNFDIFI